MSDESTVALRAILRDEISQGLKNVQAEIKRFSTTSSESVGEVNRVVEYSTEDFRKMAAQINETNKRFREGAGITKASRDEYGRLEEAVSDSIIKLKAQADALRDPVFQKAVARQAELRKEVESLTKGITEGNQAVEKHSLTWSEVVSKYYIASQAIGVVKNGVLSLVDAAKQYDSVRARLNAVEGSEVLGGRDFETAQKLAKAPGLGFEQVATTMATLRGMKMTAAETEALIQGIGRANASAAGTADTFGRVMTQINQSISIGKLNAQDLKPIIQAIPTLGAVLEEHYGAITSEALNRKLQESGKSVREFWVEVANLGAQLPAAGETIANNLDNMSDAWVRLRASITNTSLVKSATSALAGIIDAIAAANDRQTKMEDDRARARKELGDPTSFLEIGKRTSIGGPGSTNEAVARMQETQMLRESLAERLAARKEADARELADKGKKEEEAERIAEKEAEAERKRMEAHRRASMANVEFTGRNEVTMREAPGMDEAAKAHEQNVERAERAADAAYKREASLRRQREIYELEQEKRKLDAQNKLNHDALEKRKADWRSYSGAIQGFTSGQVQSILKGDFTIKSSAQSLKDFLIQQSAERLTKWVEEKLFTKAFEKADAAERLALAQSNSLAEQIIAAQKGTAITAALGPAAAAEATVSWGAAPAAGAASYASLLALTTGGGIGIPFRARGGQVSGGFIGNEGTGAEFFRPNTPGRIYNSTQQTTNNIGGATIHIHAGGGDAKAIAREVAKILPRASRLATANRLQTSRA